MKVFHGTAQYNLTVFLTGPPKTQFYSHIPPNGRYAFCTSLSFEEAALFALRKTPVSDLRKIGIVLEFDLNKAKEKKDYLQVKKTHAIRDEQEIAVFNTKKLKLIAFWEFKQGKWKRDELKDKEEKKEIFEFTHQDLVIMGAYWLRKAQYDIVDWESQICTSYSFLPDVIGIKLTRGFWSSTKPDLDSRDYHITIIEAKISRADWRSISQKHKEQCAEAGQYANQHYLLCPPGMIKKSEVCSGWGLLTIREDGYPTVIKRAKNFKLIYPEFKMPIWKIMMEYAIIGICHRLNRIGINYWGKFIESRSHLDRLQGEIIEHTQKIKDKERDLFEQEKGDKDAKKH